MHRILNAQYRRASAILTFQTKDVEISRLAAYWPAPIHAVALLAYTVVT